MTPPWRWATACAGLGLVVPSVGCSLLEPFNGYTGGDQEGGPGTGTEGGFLREDSSTGQPDGGAHPDSSDDSGTKTDSGTAPDSTSGGTDTGPMTCPDDTPFSALPWAPPTKLRQPACTATQIDTYVTNMTSGDTGCDACIQNDASAAAWGPVVILAVNGPTTFYIINYGGCLADLDGMTQQGSCGDIVNDDVYCLTQECQDCSDYGSPTANGPTQTCVHDVGNGNGVCAAFTPTGGCETETQGGGEYATCLGDLAGILTLWCGAIVDAGPPPNEGGPLEAGAGD